MQSIIAALLLGAAVTTGAVNPISSGGKQRQYILYDPGATATPKRVILAFHGLRQEAAELEKDTDINSFAKDSGYVVVYPMALGKAWNAGRCCGSEDDMTFVDDLLTELRKRKDLDANKVFVVGMSNGGMMAYRLAAERPNDIAAIAVVAGSMEAATAPSKPIPVLHIHGTKDAVVRFDGKQSKLFKPSMATQEAIDAWVTVNDCKKPPKLAQLAPAPMAVTREDYEPGTSEAEVVLITVEDGGHLWPGVPNPTFDPAWAAGLGQTNDKVVATKIIGEFFEANR